jgi:hypothetical protein
VSAFAATVRCWNFQDRQALSADDGESKLPLNDIALVQKVWNYAHVLRDQDVPYQAYISQISYLLFLKMDEERAGLAALGVRALVSAIPEDCRWPVLRDLQGEELTRRYSMILDKLSRLSGIVGTNLSQSAERDSGPSQAPAARRIDRRRDLARARRRRQRLDLWGSART